MFKGAIFDLDGVIVNTVPLHFKAWEKMFTEYNVEFNFEIYKKKVDGIPRIDGAKAVLRHLPQKEIEIACDRKQKYFLEFLERDKVPVFESTINFIKELRTNKVKTAAISSSKNSPYILKKTGLITLFNTEINGNDITKGKPDPQIFLMAANRLKLKPKTCIVFEDAILGVKAAKSARMFCVGIDRHNDPGRLKEADLTVKDLKEISYTELNSLFERKK